MRRTHDEQFKYLENQLLGADGHRCTECGDVRYIDDMAKDLDYAVCDQCAPYVRCRNAEDAEAKHDMREHGRAGQFFGTK